MHMAQIAGRYIGGKELLKLREKLKGAKFRVAGRYGVSYQTCRFCKGGAYGTIGGGLYKYGVRHYICRTCLNDADATLLARIEGRGE